MVVVAKQPNPGVVFPLILGGLCIGVGIVFPMLVPGSPLWFEIVFCGIWYLCGALLIGVAVKSRKPSGPAVIFDSTGIIWFEDLQEGQKVTYTAGQGPKGPRAENVKLV